MTPIKRRIDFNQDVPHKSIEFSPKRPQRGGQSSDAENMPPDEEGECIAPVTDFDTSATQMNGFAEDTYVPVEDDDSIQMLQTDTIHQTELPSQVLKSTPLAKPSEQRKSLANSTKRTTPASTESLKRKRGRPAKTKTQVDTAEPTSTVMDEGTTINGAVTDTEVDLDDTMAGALPSPGDVSTNAVLINGDSSPRKETFGVHRDATAEESGDSGDEYQQERPIKKGRKSKAKPEARRKPGRPSKNSKMPKERDANARPAIRQRSESKAPSDDGSAAQARVSRAPSKPRSLQILRQGTPLEEPGATKTRSGRQSIQPVAWWCGERINREFDGTIKDVIRAETVDLTPKRKGKRPTTRPKPTALGDIEEEEEQHEELEMWEEDGGILTGLVKAWDSEYNMTIEDDEVEMEVAFASNSIQTRDVMGANFSYAKLLTLPFFGAGVVDLPPGGFKRAKNSRKMQMVFFVHTGKVLVTVGDLEFSISKGGAWQVPRGTFFFIHPPQCSHHHKHHCWHGGQHSPPVMHSLRLFVRPLSV